ncbi:MAG: SdiA-regulated domain-containing protein [Campylobacterota bacterium]|nr:SdiA-regulated domain-containing protein [Campylobacterota bacterium]
MLNAKTIAKIPEASGICFLKESRELIVVNDEGWIYRLKTNGTIVEKKYLGDYDFEGVTSYKNRLLLAVEDKNAIFVVKKKSLKIIKKVQIKKHKDIKKSKKYGIEAIAVLDGEIFISKQNSDIFTIGGIQNKKAKVTKIYKHAYKDIAGLTSKDGVLHMSSDKKNLLIKYDIKNDKTLLKVKLPKSAQEGICFDDRGNIYIADDNGAVLKYKTKKLGLK